MERHNPNRYSAPAPWWFKNGNIMMFPVTAVMSGALAWGKSGLFCAICLFVLGYVSLVVSWRQRHRVNRGPDLLGVFEAGKLHTSAGSGQARNDRSIAVLRAAVPEFDAMLSTAVEKNPDIGPFEAMSRFADLGLDLLDRGDLEAARPLFEAVELLARDAAGRPLAAPLVTAFAEALHANDQAVAALGPATRARLIGYVE